MLLPIRLTETGWPAGVRRLLRRYTWPDARLVLDPDPDDAGFSRAMAALEIGPTRRITGTGRHHPADALLDQLDLSDAVVVDLGASDGITSVELVHRLGRFRQYVVTDLCLTAEVRLAAGRTVFRDAAGRVAVVVGDRLTAWPASSWSVGLLYRIVLARRASGDDTRQVSLLNPAVHRLLARDPRVSARTHDIFTAWSGPRPDLVKAANVLRRLYFADDQILHALELILSTLPEGGHLLLVDNPRISPPVPARACLYRRTADRFTLVARTGQPTEANDLALRARALRLTQAPR